MTTTLAEADKAKLRPAISKAVKALAELRDRGEVQAQEVRALVFNIATEAQVALPLKLRVLILPDSDFIMDEGVLDRVSEGLMKLSLSLR